ncbi:MAG: hypothetical protein U1D55_18320 [Phycisphaerae bacterium]
MIAAIRGGDAAPCGAFGTPEKLREDVWLVLSKDVERRIADTHSAWMRLACRAFRQVGAALYPLACLGYHAQNMLIRDFERAMPAPVA